MPRSTDTGFDGKDDYTIAYASTIQDLDKEVEAAINAGFKPSGGVAFGNGPKGSTVWAQAMVKKNLLGL